MNPVLEVEKLTIRFGGLTAVGDVDFAVREGEIFAVIGPNGAGKTTVFNAVTGVHEPTSGSIRFCGRELRRPFTRPLLGRWALVGLAVGVLLLLFGSNVDRAWLATVKANFRGHGFSVGEACRDFRDYLAGEPRVEQRAGRFFVVSNDGAQNLGAAKTAGEAEARRREALALPDVRAAMRRSRALRTGVFLLATLLGVAAGFAVWRQTRRTPTWVAQQGLARTFQNIRLFQQMTVRENVLVGMDRHLPRGALAKIAPPAGVAMLLLALALGARSGSPVAGVLVVTGAVGVVGYLARLVRLGAFSFADLAVEARARDAARELLRFVGLEPRADELAKNLPYGDQRRLEIARALATKPVLLLLDEPAAGMNPSETVGLMQLIRDIRDRGVTVLLIEHHMRVVMGISDRVAVLEYGRKIAEGTPDEVRADPKVIEAYLGREEVE